MSRITVRTTVDAPREVIFDRLADIERMPEYSTLTRAVSYISPGPVGQVLGGAKTTRSDRFRRRASG